MKRLLALGLACVLVLSASGCGGPDSLMREFIINLNAYADTLEKRESRERQAAALDRIRLTAEKLDKAKLSKDDQDKLFAKYESQLKDARTRVETAQKAYLLEGGQPADVPDVFGGKGTK
ncbi:MAG: hypothetical protein K2V38_19765 [Gemmataceae bacterium]|nr:hypothetical protein [Gemmataceae bacterium]